MSDDNVFFDNGRGVRVTSRTLTTRYKDEDLRVIRSVRVGREPFFIAAGCGAGLALFALSLDDLLLFREQLLLLVISAFLVAAGYSVASLKIGVYSFEKTVLWASYGTIRKVRQAIAKARESAEASLPPPIAWGDCDRR